MRLKKALSLVLCIAMLLSMLPMTVSAANGSGATVTATTDDGVEHNGVTVYTTTFHVDLTNAQHYLMNLSIVISYDKDLIVPVVQNSNGVYEVTSGTACFQILGAYTEQYGNPVNYETAQASWVETQSGRDAINYGLGTSNQVTIAGGKDMFSFTFRLADGKTEADLTSSSLKIVTDPTSEEIVTHFPNESGDNRKYGLRITTADRYDNGVANATAYYAADGDVVYTLTHPGSGNKDAYTGTQATTPEVNTKKGGSVTLEEQTIPGETVEFGWSTSSSTQPTNWQDSNNFTGIPDGTVYFWARVKETNNHQAGTAAVSDAVTIHTAPTLSYVDIPEMTVDSPISSISPNIAGGAEGTASFAITAGSLPEGLNFDTSTGVISGTPTKVAVAGSITVTYTDSEGQTATDEVNYGAVLGQGLPDGSFTYTEPSSLTYDGTPKTATVVYAKGITEAEAGTLTVYYNRTDAAGELTTTAPTDAGTYAVMAVTEGGTTYNPAKIVVGNFTIAKAPITVTSITVADKAYDGSTSAEISNVAFNGTVNGDDVAVDYSSASASFADANAGTGKAVTVSGLTLTGDDSDNYALADYSSVSVTATISPAEFTPVNTDTQNVVVGVGTFTQPTFPGVNGETVAGALTYTYGGSTQTYDQITTALATMSANDTAEISWSFTATDGNYVSGAKTGTINVTMVDIAFQVNGQPATEDNAVTIKSNPTYGDIWNDIVTINSSIQAVVGDTPVQGTYSLNMSGYPAAGQHTYQFLFTSSDGGYTNVEVVSGTVTVDPKTITITGVTAVDRPYDKSTTVSITGGTLVGLEPGDENVTATVPPTGTVASPDAGNNKTVTLSGNVTVSSGNYTLTQPTDITVNITRAEITSLDVTSVADVTVLASSVNSIDEVKAQIATKTATATFGSNLTEVVDITWTTSDTFTPNADRTYTFTGTVDTANLDGSGLTPLTARVNVTVKFPVNVTVTAPADVTYGTALDDPSAQQVENGYGTSATESWTFEYEGVEGTNYPRSATKPTNAGTYVVYATLVSDTHAGSGTSAPFKINPKDISGATVALPEDFTATYTGSAFEPAVTVTDGTTTLVAGTDYTVAYSNNTNAGQATVTVTGQGNYQGTVSGKFIISAKDLADGDIVISGLPESVTYTGAAIKPLCTVTFGDIALVKDTDYTVTYSDNENAGTATVKISGQGNYIGEKPATFTIAPAAAAGTVTISGTGTGENGAYVVGDTLTADVSGDKHGTLTYQWYVDGAAVETATAQTFTIPKGAASIYVVVTSSGNYEGTLTSSAIEVGKAAIPAGITLTISGNANVGQQLTAVVNDTTGSFTGYSIQWLRDGVAIPGATGETYTLTDADKGHTITARLVPGEGYTGEIVASDGIKVPATKPGVPAVTATAGDGSATIRWTVDDGGSPITQYKIQLGENTIYVDGGTTSYIFSGLSNGDTYKITVTAINAMGESAATEVTVMPKAPTPVDPGDDDDDDHHSSGGSSSSVTRYTITVEQNRGGEITPDTVRVRRGEDQTFRIRADEGYEIEDVLVDGESVGDVSRYTFENVRKAHTIEAIFRAVDEEPEEPLRPFTDVDPDGWAAEYIYYLYDQGVVNGISDTLFAPTRTITRAEFVRMLAGVAGVTEDDLDYGSSGFADVEPESWYEAYVNWAVESGVTTGTSDTTFSPTANITREQMAVMIYRFAQNYGVELPSGTSATFSDAASFSSWASEAIYAMQRAGIIDGVGGGRFAPADNATREQACKMLAVLMELM